MEPVPDTGPWSGWSHSCLGAQSTHGEDTIWVLVARTQLPGPREIAEGAESGAVTKEVKSARKGRRRWPLRERLEQVKGFPTGAATLLPGPRRGEAATQACSPAPDKPLRSSEPWILLANGCEGTQLPGLVRGECYGRKRLLLWP